MISLRIHGFSLSLSLSLSHTHTHTQHTHTHTHIAGSSAAVDGGDSAGAAASASPGESATDGGGGGSRAYNVKNFGDEKSVFGRLVYAYFRSHAVMGHLVVTMARPLKEFLKKDVDLDTNPIAVRI